MELIRYTGPNDWSALYVNGDLEIVGDHTQVDERISQICNVEEREGDYFLMGSHNKKEAAQTIEQLEAYQNRKHEQATKMAANLREKAAGLIREAEALENEYSKS